MRGPLLALVAAVLVAAPAHAAPPSLSPAAVAARTPPADAWGGVDVDLGQYFSPAEVTRWRDHRQRHRLVNLAALLLDLLIYGLLLTALGRRLRVGADAWALRLGRTGPARWPPAAALGRALGLAWSGGGWAGAMLFAYAYFALGVAVDLPTSLWHEHLSRQAGLSNYTAWGWATDFIKSLLLGGLLFSMLILGVYGLVRRFPRWWWALLAVPSGLALVAHGVASPYQTRVYHRVVPLADHAGPDGAALARQLQQLARARRVTLDEIKVVQSSRASKTLNAYLHGLGPSRELVLFDTLLREATPAEVRTVVAHELGHVSGGDTARTYLLGALGLTALLWLFSLGLRLGAARMGLPGPGDIGTLPVLGVTALLVFNLALPVTNWRSRRHELAADREALVLTGDPDAFISMQVKLARRNMADVAPSPWVEALLFTHPPVKERLAQALWYRRWLELRQRQAVDDGRRALLACCIFQRRSRP